MRKVFLTRNKIKSLLEYVAIIFGIFIIIGLFFDSQMNYSPFFVSFLSKQKIKIQYQENDPLINELKEIVSKSFSYYLDFCSLHGEINTKTGECIDNFGFPVTLLESLETLYLLDLKDLYNRAYSIVKSSFKCNELNDVNRREMWTRGVASLIGAYSLTGQKMFLEKATECGKILIQNDNKKDAIINMKTGDVKKRTLEVGIELSDLTTGFPEIYALYNYTRDDIFLRTLKKGIQILPSVKDGFPTMLSGKKFDPLDEERFDINPNTVDFYYDLTLIGLMHGTRQFQYLLNGIEEYVSLHDKEPYQYLMLEVERIRKIHFNASEELYKKGLEDHSPPFSVFKQGHPDQLVPFTFDGTFLLILYKKKQMNTISTLISASLDQCTTENGISGIGKSSKQRPFFTNVQHTSFFGEWAKFGALSSIKNERLENSIFNTRGHILYLPD